MSRIVQPPVFDGDEVTATGLNNRFTQFSQAGAINATNLRDAAVDLPQMNTTSSKFMMLNSAQVNLGTESFDLSAPRTLASYSGATFPAPAPVLDGAGVSTHLGPLGWTLTSGEILRVYWNLNVSPNGASTTNWRVAGNGGTVLPVRGGGTVIVADSGHAWLAWLQWDITSAALANWVPVYGQSDFQRNFTGALYGEQLNQTQATTVIPPWLDTITQVREGEVNTTLDAKRVGWRGVSGTYYYTVPGAPITVWGIRVVLAGLAHAYHIGNVNYFAWDPAVADAAITLSYTSGNLMALHHTTG